MRIVSGQYKGRRLVAPKTRATRPTSDRARESLFNILAHADWAPALVGARVIDLFAGSGALGLEALSRGASECLFVENARPAQTAIRDNIAALKAQKQTKLLARNAVSLGPRSQVSEVGFDFAFLDPPYGKDLLKPCLDGLAQGKWLSEQAVVIAETAVDETPDLAGWIVLNARESGAAKLWFLKAG
ncbi:MAG: 16S rRNA (guanine(966)-N(2))-methyltransferase RsmD [Henriciella sp.]|nr:16S rRNA (guanine(966)-N(2))-methyltransferase RsmD [Henriciella sp.]